MATMLYYVELLVTITAISFVIVSLSSQFFSNFHYFVKIKFVLFDAYFS